MGWSGKEISFEYDDKKIEIVCHQIPDGILVEYSYGNKKYNRVFEDKTLCEYIGKENYCSFHHATKEHINQTDFSSNLLQCNMSNEKYKKCLDKISDIIPTDCSILNYWRGMKSTFAAVSVLILEHDWTKHENTNQDLINTSHYVKDYLERTLDEMYHLSDDICYKKICKFFRKEIDYYTCLMLKKNHINCYGIIPPKCENKHNYEEIEWGPLVFWILVIILFIIILWTCIVGLEVVNYFKKQDIPR